MIKVVIVGDNNEFRGNFGTSFRTLKFQGDNRPILNRFGTGATAFANSGCKIKFGTCASSADGSIFISTTGRS